MRLFALTGALLLAFTAFAAASHVSYGFSYANRNFYAYYYYNSYNPYYGPCYGPCYTPPIAYAPYSYYYYPYQPYYSQSYYYSYPSYAVPSYPTPSYSGGCSGYGCGPATSFSSGYYGSGTNQFPAYMSG